MSSEQFQTAYDSISNISKRLLQYLQEIRESRRSGGNDSQGLQIIEDSLNRALEALQDQKYQVAVIAAMKAGKSTFLNAVIGADILASEAAACTICRTDVQHIDSEQVPRLLEYQEGKRQPVVIAEGDAGEIQHKFLVRTREIRETGNPDNTTRFKIQHPIEAISTLTSLAGFTLVDTPGPNEWESTNFNTVALKQTALEALRTCNTILFVLNYAAYKDNAVSDLFKEVIQNRQELLAENKGKIYFILNKVDQKAERDREISDVIEDLKRELTSFGFPNPIIYPASSRQGLLAKLIQQGKASESQIKDFKKFFSAKYATEDEEGNQIIPAPRKIAAQALEDSGIPTIQETVIQTITQNSGWNLLSDVLAKIDKAAKAIEDTLNTQISGWDIEIETLKQKVKEYSKHSESAKIKVETVKKSVEEQKQTLIIRFSQGIISFAEGAKTSIQNEIDKIADARTGETIKPKVYKKSQQVSSTEVPSAVVPHTEVKGGLNLPSWIPFLGGASVFFDVKVPLLETLKRAVTVPIYQPEYTQSENYDPYNIRVETKEQAQKIVRTINEFCAPHIQSWWVDTQDKLVRQGTVIREELAQRIQEDIQEISNELSSYLGNALQVELNINPIQFPSFDFPGIDARIKDVQELVIIGTKKQETGRKSRCCNSDQVYYTALLIKDKRSFYEVNLRQTAQAIKLKIDEQVTRNQELIEQVIEKQVKADFRNAEKQINDYINKFQADFDRLLREREKRGAESTQILAMLESQKAQLNKYLNELTLIKASLDSWKPTQKVR